METLLRMIPHFLPDVWREGREEKREEIRRNRRGKRKEKKKGEKRVGEDESTGRSGGLSSTERVAKKAAYLIGVISPLVFCSPQRILSLLTVC